MGTSAAGTSAHKLNFECGFQYATSYDIVRSQYVILLHNSLLYKFEGLAQSFISMAAESDFRIPIRHPPSVSVPSAIHGLGIYRTVGLWAGCRLRNGTKVPVLYCLPDVVFTVVVWSLLLRFSAAGMLT